MRGTRFTIPGIIGQIDQDIRPVLNPAAGKITENRLKTDQNSGVDIVVFQRFFNGTDGKIAGGLN